MDLDDQLHAPAPLPPRKKDPAPIVKEAELAPGSDWKGRENLVPTGIRSSDR